MKKYLFFLARLTFGIALLFFVARSLDLAKAVRLTTGINIAWALWALILVIGLRIVMAIRWKHILACQNIEVPISELIRITYISTSLGQILPGGVGPDLMRGLQLNRKYRQPVGITATILIDRLVGIYSMLFLALSGSLVAELLGRPSGLILFLFIINLLFLFGWYFSGYIRTKLESLLPCNSSLVQNLARLLCAMTNWKNLKDILPKVFLLSLFVQIIRCFVFYSLYRAYGISVDFVYYLIYIPIMLVIAFVPLSVGGLGIREGVLIYFFGTLNIAPEVNASVGILSQLLQFVAALPGLVLWLSKVTSRVGRATAGGCGP